MRLTSFLALLVAFTFVLSGTAYAEKTSKDDKRLKWMLKRFPKLDANKDGVLTESESKGKSSRPATKSQPQQPAFGQRSRAGGPTHVNVKYGGHKRNVLDFWQAKSDRPTPVIVYFHGGGFRMGDKSAIHRNPIVQQCLNAGVSFATCNYPFTNDTSYEQILHHSARAIQFIRSNSKEWKIDGRRIGAYGNSAGALISGWLGHHPDVAKRNSKDRVERYSSTLQVCGALNQPVGTDQMVLPHLKRTGAPVFLYTFMKDDVHHPDWAKKVKKHCDQKKIEAELYIRGEKDPPNNDPNTALLKFFFKHLKVKGKTT